MANNKMKVIYSITKNKEGKSFWNKIGVGFVNQDGSINGEMFAVPVDGKFQMRDFEERDGQGSGSKGTRTRASKPKEADGTPDMKDTFGDDEIPF